MKNVILRLIHSFRNVVNDTKGLTILSGKHGTCKRELVTIASELCFQNEKCCFMDVTPGGQYNDYNDALDTIEQWCAKNGSGSVVNSSEKKPELYKEKVSNNALLLYVSFDQYDVKD